jgi:hypothetical protein
MKIEEMINELKWLCMEAEKRRVFWRNIAYISKYLIGEAKSDPAFSERRIAFLKDCILRFEKEN